MTARRAVRARDGSLAWSIGAPMPVGKFLPLAIRLAGEVAELHARGVIHKDIKPDNISFDATTGELAISRSSIAAHGNARLIEGSLPYMSPEQTGRMNRTVDSRSDLYSLGVTFYQLLAGRLPFEAEDPVGWVHGHVAHKPRPVDELQPSVPRVLANIVGRLLAKVPDDRYQSALGLRHDLERCLREWLDRGALAMFGLGERDVSEQFLIPQKLYGRDAETAVLHAALERVAETGVPELVLVSGYSGIGKSALVRELLRPIVGRRGHFIAGKFEHNKRDIPYLTISQALRELALDVLAEGERQIAAWRQSLAQALGRYGKLIVDLVPQLGLILGPQPPVPELPLMEADARLRLAFRQLFAACATAEHPLTLFIDDLQWADVASLQLIADLMTESDARQLLIIGAYRDNEVDASHPLMRALVALRKRGARMTDIVLGPLSDRSLEQLVADTVHASSAEATPLARLVREKTGGNPFFAIQFLTALHHKGSIWFDRDARRWRWDVARIHAEGYTDNIAELMRGRLDGLPAETRAALQFAACIGVAVDADTLAIAFEHDPVPALQPAVDQDLLLERTHADTRSYRFPHDRVQEAAYALIPEADRARLHLAIGRRLLAHTAADELSEKVFEIVNQLERGAALVESDGERERIAELHLLAGTRAQRSTAYTSALRYLAAGAALLPANAWECRYDLAFAFELHSAECEFLTGALEMAQHRLEALLVHVASAVDLAAVTCLQIEVFERGESYESTVEACLRYLRRVGVEWSAHPTDDDARREYDRIWQQLGSRSIEELVDLPPMIDPDHRATMNVLTRIQLIASGMDPRFGLLVVCRMVNLSLEHGNDDSSGIGYVGLGATLGPSFGDYVVGYRFGRLGIELVEKRGVMRSKARAYLEFASQIHPWNRHMRSGVDLLQHTFDIATEAGDLTFACYSGDREITLLLAAGEPLPALQQVADRALAFAEKLKHTIVTEVATVRLQLVRSLRGMTRGFGSLDDAMFIEDRFEKLLESQPRPAIIVFWYWIRKLQARLFAGDHAAAVAAAAKARPLESTSLGFVETAEYVFFDALASAAYHDAARIDERPQLEHVVAARLAQLAIWAQLCPDNFRGLAALVAAELARIRGEAEQAIPLYEQAIRSAREYSFIHIEAIAYETAARFYRQLGQALVADAYVREAYARYRRWGADGKVRQLRRAHPDLEPDAAGHWATQALRPEQLDQLSVIKAMQTISSVMDKERLLRTLLRLVLEEAGARRALLVLLHDGELEIAAEATTTDADLAPAPRARVPRSVLTYVQRTQQRVLLDAAVDLGRFTHDPYFADTRPRSVLCLPVRRQAEAIALLYVENDLVPSAFTPEGLLALQLLAAQAAISLENALLLEREHVGRIEAEAAGQRELLLGEATALMSQTIDLQGVFCALARLCAQSFADWAVIDLDEHGELVRFAGAHRDPAKEPLLRELAERYPARAGTTVPARHVLETGLLYELPEISEHDIAARSVDEHHRDLIVQLGTRSAVVVPLRARDTLLGALTLTSATPHRFQPADVELAMELGRRAAMAIDNARLLDETRRALHLREEFLRVASHELRTPLASLRLTAESLLRAAEVHRAVSPETMDRSLRRVLSKTARLEQLTSELIDVTRLEQGKLEVVPVELALDTLVRETVAELERELDAAGCTVSIGCAAPVIGRWDRSGLEQVVTSLLTNAIKFGPGRPIEIRIDRIDGHARLIVTDHGIGIDPARRPYVFERFERAVPSASYGGLGLGLYIARSIVLAHGGTITVDSMPGEGSTFTVTLPPVWRGAIHG